MSERTEHLRSNREHERVPLEDGVTVTLEQQSIRGSGKNASPAGVYFIAEEEIKVKVTIGDMEYEGHLVRVENHGKGRTGLAVRFEEDQ